MVKFISEISSNHNSNLKRCYKLIDESSKIGCYAVKFQLFKVDKLFHKLILSKSSNHRKIKKWELPKNYIPLISKYAKKKKLKFSCTPFYFEAVNYLKKYVDFFKIGSYEILWTDFLIEIAKTKKPVILSTGMANINEISKAIKTLKKNGCNKIILLHCVSQYPADIRNCNLRSIKFLSDKFNCEVGWSDHTKNPLLVFDAITNFSAKYIEFHFDLNDGKGLESQIGHCWKPNEIYNLTKYIKNKKIIEGKLIKKPNINEIKERNWRTDPSDGLRPLKKIRRKFK